MECITLNFGENLVNNITIFPKLHSLKTKIISLDPAKLTLEG